MFKRAIIISLLFLMNCSKSHKNKGNVYFKVSKDSIEVFYKNELFCPVFTKIEDLKTGNLSFVQSKAKETSRVMSFSNTEADSISILDKYKFGHYYGYYQKDKQAYDTLFNYALPFPKGKRYKIIQGYNGSFSHNTNFSRYTLDFNLQIDDTIQAARDGIVIKIIDKHTKQGTTKKYRPYGNYIMIHHSDNTFAQYVHLKQNGALVNVGDTIKRHQAIALSGFTGLTTTPHLHFGVFKATTNGFVSIPIVIDSVPGKRYLKNKIAVHD